MTLNFLVVQDLLSSTVNLTIRIRVRIELAAKKRSLQNWNTVILLDSRSELQKLNFFEVVNLQEHLKLLENEPTLFGSYLYCCLRELND